MAYLPAKPEKPASARPEQVVLSSSFLQSAEYDPSNFAVTLWFKSKLSIIHRYFFPVTWEQFKIAPSHGSFYSRNIKGKYPTIQLHPQLKSSDITKAKQPHKLKEA